jgi:hypothetical protein
MTARRAGIVMVGEGQVKSVMVALGATIHDLDVARTGVDGRATPDHDD